MFLPVIMSGGSGERLWPVSRSSFPKPFIVMPDGYSLLQKTFLRAAGLPDVSEVLTVTNKEHYFKTKSEYDKLAGKQVSASFILEPFPRNTAPAIAMAASYALKAHGEDTVLLVLSADQLIENMDAFADAIREARILAEKGYIATFGINPTRPETGFGYIEIPEKGIEGFINSYKVKRFVEKPDLATAEEYVNSKKYLWNAGIFCFKAGVFLRELEKYSPDILHTIEITTKNLDLNQAAHGYVELEEELFAKVPSISVDYAIMEKSDKVAVVACDIGWNDVGSWNALGELIPSDKNDNRSVGEVYTHDSTGCLIQSGKRVVAAVGVKDLVIVDTPDALLVANKGRVQEVKNIVGQLKEQGHSASKEHTTVFRPWGCYTVIEEGIGFKIKRIEVLPHQSLSLQTHEHRSEHWVVVSGVASVQNDTQCVELRTSESTYIPAGNKHRLSNNGDDILVIIEVQCGAYLGEDDIIRFDDVYGRTKL